MVLHLPILGSKVLNMEYVSVPSRFSCLKIEDDEFLPVTNKSNKKKPETKSALKKPVQISTAKKPPPKQEQSSTGTTKKSKSKNKDDNKQWEEWQKKDNEYLDENFEQDLQSAILQSKLEFENQKKNGVLIISNSNKDVNNLKKKKPKTMSLDQFLEGETPAPKKDVEEKGKEPDEDFFKSVAHSAKQEAKKEKYKEKTRERSNNIEEIISLAQCQEKLQNEKALNIQLKQELEESKKEITVVKKRNKTLCNMLSQGEMKDKATILLELEKLMTVKEELTEEVTRLHKLLEQERSRFNSTNSTSSTSESHSKQKTKKKKT